MVAPLLFSVLMPSTRPSMGASGWRSLVVPLLLMCVGLACSAAPEDSPKDASALPVTAWKPLVVATFNTGTTEAMGHDSGPDDGYTAAMAKISDTYYGDGLAWKPAVAATKAWFDAQTEAGAPIDIVGFQEIFWSGDCAAIPTESWPEFYCEELAKDAPTVARHVLGSSYQVVCHPGKNDKCVGVRKAFGRVRGCPDDFCLTAGVGVTIAGCGQGSRVVRLVIDRVDGGVLTVVHVHGSSGLKAEDQSCRTKQFAAVFEAMDDGEPGLNGDVHVVLGDLNTDPHRFLSADKSAKRLLQSVAYTAEEADTYGKPLHFITGVGDDAPATYGGVASIDHVLSDKLNGTCWAAGLTTDKPPVLDARYFDHKPVVCKLIPR